MALTGKTALITGGSQGIGAAVVRRFSKENANVWFGDIDRKRGNELARELSQAGLPAKFLPLDVTKASQWKAIIK
jgi:NAD(P)-dependent dehydrogenase (short-subunit alcohol dehydrogenase family)